MIPFRSRVLARRYYISEGHVAVMAHVSPATRGSRWTPTASVRKTIPVKR